MKDIECFCVLALPTFVRKKIILLKHRQYKQITQSHNLMKKESYLAPNILVNRIVIEQPFMTLSGKLKDGGNNITVEDFGTPEETDFTDVDLL